MTEASRVEPSRGAAADPAAAFASPPRIDVPCAGRDRNPLYVGLDLIYIGLSLLINSLWGLLMLAPLLVVMHYGVILREERYLAARFGESYGRYRASVRRYL